MQKKRHLQNTPAESKDSGSSPVFINAATVGARYGVTGRFILQLAAEKKLPCLRLGKKCVRFDPDAVAKAFDDPNFGQQDETSNQEF